MGFFWSLIGVLVGGRPLLLGAEEVVGEVGGLRDLEERFQRARCTAQAGEYRVEGGAPHFWIVTLRLIVMVES